MSAWTCRRLMARPPERLFHLVFESHSGRAPVPSPKRSASPRATSTLQWRIGLKALDPERPIREADIATRPLSLTLSVGQVFGAGFLCKKAECARNITRETDQQFTADTSTTAQYRE